MSLRTKRDRIVSYLEELQDETRDTTDRGNIDKAISIILDLDLFEMH
jgi:hypothetical protein